MRPRLLAAPAACLAVAAGTAPFLFGRHRAAVHWNAAGHPDSHLSGPAAWAVTGGIGVAGALVALLAGRRRTARLAGLGGAALFSALGVLVAVANAGGRERNLPPLLAVPVVLVVLAAVGAVLLSDSGGSRRRSPPVRRSRATPEPGRVLWQGRCRSSFALPTLLVFLAAAVVIGVLIHPLAGAAVAAGGLCVLALVEIQVLVTPEVLQVRYSGPVRWPRTTIAVDGITEVRVVEVDPKRYGGWGYRGSLRLYRRAAINLRRGPGLRLALRDGAVLVVTVDDAAAGAEALRRALAPHS